MKYVFKYRRRWWWKSVEVAGHNYDVEQDKMVLFFENGAVQEIAKWRECELMLGPDWALAKKKSIEEQAGQSVPVRGV
jgi:hypothetical protein